MNKIQQYLQAPETRGLAKSTRSLYTTALKYYEKYVTNHKPTDLAGFATWLEKKKLSGRSIQQYLNSTKIFLKWCGTPIEFTYKITNQERKKNKLKHARRWLTEIEIDMCLAYPFARYTPTLTLGYRILVRLLAETGARVRELANIRAEDIELSEQTIWLNVSKTQPRCVFFSKQTKEMLESYLQIVPNKGTVFPSVDRIKQVINEMLSDLELKNGGKDGRGAHVFRHYVATKLFYENPGMRLEDIATLLGDKVQTIREYYLHPTPKMLKRRVSDAMGWIRN